MSAARRQGCRMLVAIGVVAAVSLMGAGAAEADASFTITTSAEGIAVTVSNQSFPLVQSAESNAPTAQSTLNSRQFGTSYSAAPDPGLTIAELPTTTAGELCGEAGNPPGCPAVAAAVPAYPYAYAQTGDLPQSQNLGAASLYADATTISANAITTMNGTATSTTHAIANADDSVDGSAVSDVTGLQISTSVTLSSIHAAATVHRDPTGKITTTSAFDVGDINIAGTQVGLMNGQFVAMGVGLPVPVDPNTVLKALAAAGVAATYLPATTTATGVVSAGLQLQYSVPGVPSGTLPQLPAIPGSPINVGVPATPTTVTYALGLVSANATYKVIPGGTDSTTGGTVSGGDFSGGSLTSTAPTTTPVVTAPATTTPSVTTPVTTTPATSPATSPVSPAGGAATDGTTPATSGATLAGPASGDVLTADPPPTVADTATAAAPAAKTAALAGTIPLTGDSIDIYLALVAAAFLAFGGSHAIRLLGVRFRWGS